MPRICHMIGESESTVDKDICRECTSDRCIINTLLAETEHLKERIEQLEEQ